MKLWRFRNGRRTPAGIDDWSFRFRFHFLRRALLLLIDLRTGAHGVRIRRPEVTTAEAASVAPRSKIIPPDTQPPAAQPATALAHSFARLSRTLHSLCAAIIDLPTWPGCQIWNRRVRTVTITAWKTGAQLHSDAEAASVRAFSEGTVAAARSTTFPVSSTSRPSASSRSGAARKGAAL